MVTAGILESLPLFAGLPGEQMSALLGSSTLRKCPRGAFILREGERTEGVYVILAGRAKVTISDEEGREIILATIGPRDFFGEMGSLDDHPRSANVKATERCDLLCISKACFMRCLSDSRDFALRITRALVRRLREADRKIESLALMDVYGRVARVLLDLADDTEGRRVIHRAPSKQEIANMIGASREMVSRVMKDLHNSGHIFIEKRRIVLFGKTAGVLSRSKVKSEAH